MKRTTKPVFRSAYNPARGGHAPGDLRDVFCEAIEKYARDGEFPRVITLREQRVSLAYVCVLLRNCVDVLPGSIYDCLEGPKSRSYAAAARHIKSMLGTRRSA